MYKLLTAAVLSVSLLAGASFACGDKSAKADKASAKGEVVQAANVSGGACGVKAEKAAVQTADVKSGSACSVSGAKNAAMKSESACDVNGVKAASTKSEGSCAVSAAKTADSGDCCPMGSKAANTVSTETGKSTAEPVSELIKN